MGPDPSLTEGNFRRESSDETLQYLSAKPQAYRDRLDKAVSDRDLETVLEMAGECGIE